MEELVLKLKDINYRKSVLEAEEKALKNQIQTQLNGTGFKNDFVTISYSVTDDSTSIDLKKLKEKEPDLYKELLKDYPKISKGSAKYSYRFK